RSLRLQDEQQGPCVGLKTESPEALWRGREETRTSRATSAYDWNRPCRVLVLACDSMPILRSRLGMPSVAPGLSLVAGSYAAVALGMICRMVNRCHIGSGRDRFMRRVGVAPASDGRPQESPKSPQVSPRDRAARPLSFAQDRGAGLAGDVTRHESPFHGT